MLNATIFAAKIEEWLSGEPHKELFDAVLCDPPYELDFMGKHWDNTGIAFNPEIWRGVFNRLKPGGFLLAFGGTRTFHRLTCAIEDAGFEIRDCMMWLYSGGFPKNHDIGGRVDRAAGGEPIITGWKHSGLHHRGGSDTFTDDGWQAANRRGDFTAITEPSTDSGRKWKGYGTVLKPAWEPVIVAMKPVEKTYLNNALTHGVSGLNIGACRVPASQGDIADSLRKSSTEKRRTYQEKDGRIYGEYAHDGSYPIPQEGRWPANVTHDGSDEVMDLMPETAAARSGNRGKGWASEGSNDGWKRSTYDAYLPRQGGHNDSGGSAARFFYAAKAYKTEKHAGLDGRNPHPTVKPLELIKYLATLILPPKRDNEPRRLLVPFAGSGSEMIGAMLAGWESVTGVEMSPEFADVATRRFAWWQAMAEKHGTSNVAAILKAEKDKGKEDQLRLHFLEHA